jgi:hypothetical protein
LVCAPAASASEMAHVHTTSERIVFQLFDFTPFILLGDQVPHLFSRHALYTG